MQGYKNLNNLKFTILNKGRIDGLSISIKSKLRKKMGFTIMLKLVMLEKRNSNIIRSILEEIIQRFSLKF